MPSLIDIDPVHGSGEKDEIVKVNRGTNWTDRRTTRNHNSLTRLVTYVSKFTLHCHLTTEILPQDIH